MSWLDLPAPPTVEGRGPEPYDGELYILLCQSGDPEEPVYPTEDDETYRTIGYWQEYQGWVMAGWDWCQDQFRDGHGKPIKYAKLLAK